MLVAFIRAGAVLRREFDAKLIDAAALRQRVSGAFVNAFQNCRCTEGAVPSVPLSEMCCPRAADGSAPPPPPAGRRDVVGLVPCCFLLSSFLLCTACTCFCNSPARVSHCSIAQLASGAGSSTAALVDWPYIGAATPTQDRLAPLTVDLARANGLHVTICLVGHCLALCSLSFYPC
jgi:hypothetical protein